MRVRCRCVSHSEPDGSGWSGSFSVEASCCPSEESLGLLLGLWSAGGLVAFPSQTPLPLRLDVRLNQRRACLTACRVVTAIVFGLLPALARRDPNLVPALKDAPSLNMRMSRIRLQPKSPLPVIGQIALTLVLLVAAGLFVRSLMNLQKKHANVA